MVTIHSGKSTECVWMSFAGSVIVTLYILAEKFCLLKDAVFTKLNAVSEQLVPL
jgi:hypothetical protein